MKSLYESILDSDYDIIKSRTDLIKFVDKTVDVLYDHLKNFKKMDWKGDYIKHIYQFTTYNNMNYIEAVIRSTVKDLKQTWIKYKVKYENTLNSFICNYIVEGRNLTILVTSGSNRLFPTAGEKVMSFITIHAFTGTYQRNNYTTDPELEDIFNEAMDKKFKIKR